ncbi:hypothetical protein TUM18999_27770 [Pseudomonas tohonis]|uniref:Lipoprotein n=1 Tax=Pseudomonas tohonis TaxID=2725477 RepID=A0A6J4E5R4_9PSED|nr:hypothetical protein [Pseudomonas tohonis]BCG24586.1 hypothetical protein TUM18999_27770 [Pseudomonas tohonis]GJN52055.1 hypothetical protein TUM20286_18070 [Pseudomonas tohonis]
MQKNLTDCFAYLTLLVAVFLQGCATAIKPDDLAAPTQISCVYLDKPLSYTETLGMFDIPWTTRLEKGPYWSEKVDAKGTYYRAPPGALSLQDDEGRPMLNAPRTRDGGFYVPNDPTAPITLYYYFSTSDAPSVPEWLDTDCTKVAAIREPHSEKISVVALAVGGAISGAAVASVSRSIANSNSVSYGQAAGAGAAGGLIGGVIIATMINADVGKIMPFFPPPNATGTATLKALVAEKKLIPELQSPSTATAEVK